MNKALPIVFSLIALGIASPLLCATPAGAAKRIGILYQDPGVLAQIDKFRETLQGLGFVEGKTVGYEYRVSSAPPCLAHRRHVPGTHFLQGQCQSS